MMAPGGAALLLDLDLRQLIEANDVRLLAERVREAALRQPARERHLPALEARLSTARAVMARARLDAFMALARRLARAGARSTPEALPIPIAARHGREVVQADLFRGHCLLLDGLHLDEVAHLLELSTQRRGILLDHHVLMVLEADRLERPVHPPRVSDPTPDLPDADLAGRE